MGTPAEKALAALEEQDLVAEAIRETCERRSRDRKTIRDAWERTLKWKRTDELVAEFVELGRLLRSFRLHAWVDIALDNQRSDAADHAATFVACECIEAAIDSDCDKLTRLIQRSESLWNVRTIGSCPSGRRVADALDEIMWRVDEQWERKPPPFPDSAHKMVDRLSTWDGWDVAGDTARRKRLIQDSHIGCRFADDERQYAALDFLKNLGQDT